MRLFNEVDYRCVSQRLAIKFVQRTLYLMLELSMEKHHFPLDKMSLLLNDWVDWVGLVRLLRA